MKRDYRVLAFRTTDISFHETFEAESQDESIQKMVRFLKESGSLTQKEVEELRFLSCPADFNAVKEVDGENVEKVQ